MRSSIIIFTTILLIPLTVSAVIIHVPRDYRTIQAAVDNCCSGDEILVAPGVYGPVYADSLFDITFTGAGFLEPHKTVIDVADSSVGMWIWYSGKITVQGFEIRNCWEGCLAFEYSSDIHIQENYLHDCNDVHGNSLGIRGCEDVWVTRNIIVNSYEISIYVDPVSMPDRVSKNLRFINNTIGFTGTGSTGADGLTIAWSDSNLYYVNNINVFNSDYGLNYKFAVQTNTSVIAYNDHFGNLWGPWGDCSPTGPCIYQDPLFIGGTGAEAYFLDPESPCVDAGDPTIFDPDGTRSDIGALYYDQGPGRLEIEVRPVTFPPEIPASGGSYQYAVKVINHMPNAQVFDVWLKLFLPDGSVIDPLLVEYNQVLPGNQQLIRYPWLTLSAAALPGGYQLIGYVGRYSSTVDDSSGFAFTKAGTDEIVPTEHPFAYSSGWDDAESLPETVLKLEKFDLYLQASPNPFNNNSCLEISVPLSGQARLNIYDISGREAAVLYDGWLSAGNHTYNFQADGLATGIYFARLQTAEGSEIRKLVMVK